MARPYHHGGGKPKIFNTPEEFQKACDEYFDMCDGDTETKTDSKGNEKTIHKPYTITGLCVYLGTTRTGLFEYKSKDGYRQIYEYALSRCENYLEENALTNKLNPVVSIFSLKNNYNWVDQQTVNVSNGPDKLSVDDIKARLEKLKGEGNNKG